MDEQMELAITGGEAERPDAIQREAPQDLPEQRRALVKRWQREIKADKAHFAKVFDRMREDMELAAKGADKEWFDQDRYIVPVVQRHINQAVAQLYAKNPKATAKRKQRLDFVYWDGTQQSLNEALIGQHPMAPQIVQEVQEVRAKHQQMDKIAKTSEILFNYFITEQQPDFKAQVKQMVRRTKTCAVGYVKLNFQRAFDKNPDVEAKIADTSSQIAHLQALLADAADNEIQEGDAKLEELKLSLENLRQQEEMIVREGPVFDFPRATEVVPDRKVRQLRNFVGARYVTHEFHMTVDEVKKVYEIDVSAQFTPYDGPSHEKVEEGTVMQETHGHGMDKAEEDRGNRLTCVWEVWDKNNRQVFTIVDGYTDFVRAPKTPVVNIERFFPFFVLVFNEIESADDVYPLSDVRMLRHAQMEYNRSREGLRQHRIANAPKYFVRQGILEEDDEAKIQSAAPQQIIRLQSMEDIPINNLIQPHQPVPIDPNLYETGSLMDDVLRTVGTQEANIGGTGAETATESSIAENSRMTSLASNVDDLDELLTDLAQATNQLMLMEMDPDYVRQIAGPGAVWPDMTRQEAAEEIFLEIKAGSSGRPNKAAELANLERGMPYVIQMPGSSAIAEQMLRRYLDLLEIEFDEAVMEGMPSITALNNMMGRAQQGAGSGNSMGNGESAGEPDSDPEQQGGQGGNNAPSSQPRQAGPQPAMPDGINNMTS